MVSPAIVTCRTPCLLRQREVLGDRFWVDLEFSLIETEYSLGMRELRTSGFTSIFRQQLGFSFAFSTPPRSGSLHQRLAPILVVAVIFPLSLARVLSDQRGEREREAREGKRENVQRCGKWCDFETFSSESLVYANFLPQFRPIPQNSASSSTGIPSSNSQSSPLPESEVTSSAAAAAEEEEKFFRGKTRS
ncbi:hypothetical protein TIFTF001_000050 [Ficus carica]|uniref:Uncharacterized protein n=1 Tax=Ficus carica TaxID=3494 RepID=A0AA88D090_FICCA|nr:hypothetical protein TIFTF001_000050 [Ficus carica]